LIAGPATVILVALGGLIGAADVEFVGRFFGPLRCIMPLVAGVCEMKQIPFQIANLSSAALWGPEVNTVPAITAAWFAAIGAK
jgi:membrane protein DedA with SNARE-associated domain